MIYSPLAAHERELPRDPPVVILTPISLDLGQLRWRRLKVSSFLVAASIAFSQLTKLHQFQFLRWVEIFLDTECRFHSFYSTIPIISFPRLKFYHSPATPCETSLDSQRRFYDANFRSFRSFTTPEQDFPGCPLSIPLKLSVRSFINFTW